MKLPFITKPKSPETLRIGNNDIGVLEIPKLGDLSINERIWIKEQLKNVPDIRKSAAQLAQAIAVKSNITQVEVYDALVSGNTVILQEHLEEVMTFQTLMGEVASARSLMYATAILLFRLAPEWTSEDTGDANQIHPALVAEVATFAFREESQWAKTDEDEAVEPEVTTDEDLGKLSTPPKRSRSGAKSTGESVDTGEATKGSVPLTLEISPVG